MYLRCVPWMGHVYPNITLKKYKDPKVFQKKLKLIPVYENERRPKKLVNFLFLFSIPFKFKSDVKGRDFGSADF